MDTQPPPESMTIDQSYAANGAAPADQEMGGTEESNGNGYPNSQRSHYVSQSADYPQSNQAFSPPLESDGGSRYNSPSMAYAQQASQNSTSRPGSGLGQQDYSRQYQENRQQPAQNKSSVVIKVGMVGDAQIGKTSLMVKYVEGSWDEDYIQTLGMFVTGQEDGCR